MKLTGNVCTGLKGSYLAYKIEQMAKAVSKNETMANAIYFLKEFKKNRKRITLRLHGLKGKIRSMKLAEKPPHPKSDDLFNSTNSI